MNAYGKIYDVRVCTFTSEKGELYACNKSNKGRAVKAVTRALF